MRGLVLQCFEATINRQAIIVLHIIGSQYIIGRSLTVIPKLEQYLHCIKSNIFLILDNWWKYHIFGKTKIKEKMFSITFDILRNKSIERDIDETW